MILDISFERLEQRLELNLKGLGVARYRRYLAIDTKQLVDGHLGGTHRILNSKDHIIRNFDKLTDEPRS